MPRYLVTVRFSADGRLEVAGDEIAVSIKSPPERGRANRELVKRLAGHFGVAESAVRIVSGLASRKKVVDILQASSAAKKECGRGAPAAGKKGQQQQRRGAGGKKGEEGSREA